MADNAAAGNVKPLGSTTDPPAALEIAPTTKDGVLVLVFVVVVVGVLLSFLLSCVEYVPSLTHNCRCVRYRR